MVLGVAVGLLVGMLLDNFILGFLALAGVAGLGWLLLSRFGPDIPHNHRSTRESREGQQVPSFESSARR